MKNLILSTMFLFVSISQADGFSVACGENSAQGAAKAEAGLVLQGDDHTLYLNGVEQPDADDEKSGVESTLKVVKGPRHRKGIDGYEVWLQKPGSPHNSREVYYFFTKYCFDVDGEVYMQKSTGAGIGREKAVGPELKCSCSPLSKR